MNSLKKTKYVLFMGLGGSGKSSIIKKLVSLLEQKGFSAISFASLKDENKFKKYFSSVVRVFSSRKSLNGLWFIIKFFFLVKPWRKSDLVNYFILVQNYFAKELAFSFKGKDFYIWENEYHIISEFDLSGLSDTTLSKIISSFMEERGTTVVYISTPYNVCLERALSESPEKRPLLFKQSQSERIRDYKRSEFNQKRIFELLRKEGKVDLIEIGDDLSIDKATDIILNKLAKYEG